MEQKEQDLSAKTLEIQKAQHSLNRERILVQNEAQKVNSLFRKFSELSHGPEVTEQLASIRVLLELLINDRNLGGSMDVPSVL